jgi:adenylate cyclase class IV
MIEIEKRGPLNPTQYKTLQQFLKDKGEQVLRCNQVGIFTTYKNGEVKNQINISITQDLDINTTKARLKAKLGDLKDSARKEISIPFDIKDIDSIYDMLRMFGVTNGCPRYYYREDYRYKNFNISIKSKGLLEDHYEIEVELDDNGDKDAATKEILEFLSSQNLSYWEEDEYKVTIKRIFEENPPIDFSEISLSEYLT